MDYSQYRQYRFSKTAALPLILGLGAAAAATPFAVWGIGKGINSMFRKSPTDHENKSATMMDMGDAIVDQMNTGKHNLSGVSAAEHAIRMSTDDKYKNDASTYIKQRIKANAGWAKDQNGNFVKNPNTHYDTQFAQETAMAGFKAPEVSSSDKRTAWKNAGKPKDFKDPKKREAMTNQAMADTVGAIRSGFVDSAKARHNISSDLGGFGMYASARGMAPSWVGWLGKQYRQNPWLVWGGLAAGVIGIGALVNNFLGSRNQQPQVVYQQAPAPTATTSFWRN